MTVIHIIRKYPLSTLCIVGIWVLSLLPFFPETPLDDIQFIDKWTHLVMYGVTGIVVWAEYWFRNRNNSRSCSSLSSRFLILSFLLLTLMGGLLEVLQEYCTTTRNGDWIDFLADAAGCAIATIIGWVFLTRTPRQSVC